ncbi:unnamed protein product [Pedinophyceae sp. YPF-701]|nr:unnamed protein product [Pedinophyceae sp. YPF-701]
MALPPTLVFDYPTINAMSQHIAEQLGWRPGVSDTTSIVRGGSLFVSAGQGGLLARAPEPVLVCSATNASFDGRAIVCAAAKEQTAHVPMARFDPDSASAMAAADGARLAGPIRFGAWMDGVELFDTSLYRIPRVEAEMMDPHHRLLLSRATVVVADSRPPVQIVGGAGVYVGISTEPGYSAISREALKLGGETASPFAATSSPIGAACGRIGFLLGMGGPTMSVDTACSAGLVAASTAASAIMSGSIGAAVACSVKLNLTIEPYFALAAMSVLSADGRCKVFDASADGYGRAEDCEAMWLQSAHSTHQDVAPLALLVSCAVNQNASGTSLTAPHGPSQQALVKSALVSARATAASVAGVFLAANGTPLGDPIETNALAEVFAPTGGDERVSLMSSKGFFGHGEQSSGTRSMLEALHMLQANALPPVLHLRDPSPAIKSILETPWTPAISRCEGPNVQASADALFGVSSFGYAGTNAHVLLRRTADVEASAHGTLGPSAVEAIACFAPERCWVLPTEPLWSRCMSVRFAGAQSSFTEAAFEVGIDSTRLASALAGGPTRSALPGSVLLDVASTVLSTMTPRPQGLGLGLLAVSLVASGFNILGPRRGAQGSAARVLHVKVNASNARLIVLGLPASGGKRFVELLTCRSGAVRGAAAGPDRRRTSQVVPIASVHLVSKLVVAAMSVPDAATRGIGALEAATQTLALGPDVRQGAVIQGVGALVASQCRSSAGPVATAGHGCGAARCSDAAVSLTGVAFAAEEAAVPSRVGASRGLVRQTSIPSHRLAAEGTVGVPSAVSIASARGAESLRQLIVMSKQERSEHLEGLILSTISRVVGADLDPEDKIADAGVDSRAALLIHTDLRTRTGIDVPLMDVFECQTAAELSDVLSRFADRAAAEMADDGAGPSGQPGEGGEVEVSTTATYKWLSTHTPPKTLFLATPIIIEGPAAYRTFSSWVSWAGADIVVLPKDDTLSIMQLAEWGVRDILSVQPKGPYLVGGYSHGGIIAMEIAMQLESAGHEVGLVVLFDPPTKEMMSPFSPHETSASDKDVQDLMEMVLCALGPMATGSSLKPWDNPEWTGLSFQDKLAFFCTIYDGFGYHFTPDTLLADLRKRALDHKLGRAANDPRLHTFSSRVLHSLVLYYRCTEKASHFLIDDVWTGPHAHGPAWSQHAANVEIFQVPGDHYTVLRQRDEDVRILVDVLRARLHKYGWLDVVPATVQQAVRDEEELAVRMDSLISYLQATGKFSGTETQAIRRFVSDLEGLSVAACGATQLSTMTSLSPPRLLEYLNEVGLASTQNEIYVIHGLSGDCMAFRDAICNGGIARHSAERFVGIQLPPIKALRTAGLHRSIAKLAAFYAGLITAVQPAGPYYIAGHGHGCAIAHEVARGMQEQGLDVRSVILYEDRVFAEVSDASAKMWLHLWPLLSQYASVSMDTFLRVTRAHEARGDGSSEALYHELLEAVMHGSSVQGSDDGEGSGRAVSVHGAPSPDHAELVQRVDFPTAVEWHQLVRDAARALREAATREASAGDCIARAVMTLTARDLAGAAETAAPSTDTVLLRSLGLRQLEDVANMLATLVPGASYDLADNCFAWRVRAASTLHDAMSGSAVIKGPVSGASVLFHRDARCNAQQLVSSSAGVLGSVARALQPLLVVQLPELAGEDDETSALVHNSALRDVHDAANLFAEGVQEVHSPWRCRAWILEKADRAHALAALDRAREGSRNVCRDNSNSVRVARNRFCPEDPTGAKKNAPPPPAGITAPPTLRVPLWILADERGQCIGGAACFLHSLPCPAYFLSCADYGEFRHLDSVAEAYANVIVREQPGGPYVVVGLSLIGSQLAGRVVDVLTGRGARAAGVFVDGTPAPSAMRREKFDVYALFHSLVDLLPREQQFEMLGAAIAAEDKDIEESGAPSPAASGAGPSQPRQTNYPEMRRFLDAVHAGDASGAGSEANPQTYKVPLAVFAEVLSGAETLHDQLVWLHRFKPEGLGMDTFNTLLLSSLKRGEVLEKMSSLSEISHRADPPLRSAATALLAPCGSQGPALTRSARAVCQAEVVVDMPWAHGAAVSGEQNRSRTSAAIMSFAESFVAAGTELRGSPQEQDGAPKWWSVAGALLDSASATQSGGSQVATPRIYGAGGQYGGTRHAQRGAHAGPGTQGRPGFFSRLFGRMQR